MRAWNYLGTAMNGNLGSCNRDYFSMSNIVLLLGANVIVSMYIRLHIRYCISECPGVWYSISIQTFGITSNSQVTEGKMEIVKRQ